MTRSERLRARLERLKARVAAMDAKVLQIMLRARPLRRQAVELKAAVAKAERVEKLQHLLAELPPPEGPRITSEDLGGLPTSVALRRVGVTHRNQWHAMAEWPSHDLYLIPGIARKSIRALRERWAYGLL